MGFYENERIFIWKQANKFCILAILLMFLIFVESSIPMDGGPDNSAFLTNLNPNVQNLLYIQLYWTLAFLWVRFFGASGKHIYQMLLYSLIITIIYGCLDEVHQSFVRGRYSGFLDICINIVGVLGSVVFFCSRTKAQRHKLGV